MTILKGVLLEERIKEVLQKLDPRIHHFTRGLTDKDKSNPEDYEAEIIREVQQIGGFEVYYVPHSSKFPELYDFHIKRLNKEDNQHA